MQEWSNCMTLQPWLDILNNGWTMNSERSLSFEWGGGSTNLMKGRTYPIPGRRFSDLFRSMEAAQGSISLTREETNKLKRRKRVWNLPPVFQFKIKLVKFQMHLYLIEFRKIVSHYLQSQIWAENQMFFHHWLDDQPSSRRKHTTLLNKKQLNKGQKREHQKLKNLSQSSLNRNLKKKNKMLMTMPAANHFQIQEKVQ